MEESNQQNKIFIIPSDLPSIYSNNALSKGISFEASVYYQKHLKEHEDEQQDKGNSENNTSDDKHGGTYNHDIYAGGGNTNDDNGYWKSTYAIIILLSCVVSSMTVILIPQHNVIKYPEYWYELIFISILGHWSFFVINITLVCAKVLHYQEFKSFDIICDLFLTASMTQSLSYSLSYVVWSHLLDFNHPMPFSGDITFYIVFFVVIIRLWYKFPQVVRKNPAFHARLRAHMFYWIWVSVINFQFCVMNKLFTMIRTDLQWILVIVLPLIKELNDFVITTLMCKVAKCNIMGAKSVVKIYLSYNYSLFFVLILGTRATEITNYCILAINFIYNLYLCFKIIVFSNKILPTYQREMAVLRTLKKEVLTELLLNEIIEIMVPVTYICTFTIAYYGPNSEILGNVRNDYWAYQKVESITTLFTFALQMALIDLLSAVFSGVLLWKYCRLNFLQEYCKVMKKYWPILTLTAVVNINKV